ncbi:hypothetical protein C8R44DRAFT_855254 [Mycena epipterygia]|nr:hypothetical protein C8R44DRAFT_855254 [Mycena epipterygia]
MIIDTESTCGDAPPAYEARVPSSLVPEAAPWGRSSIVKASPVATSWFTSPTTRQVRATVLGLVRDLVKSQAPDTAISILQSCAAACAANNLSLSAVLQEKSVEGHTPLYWAIIKRPAADANDLLTALLTLSSPLNPATTSDVRLACLLTSDQALFQQLRASPIFAPLSTTDALLLDAPADTLRVESAGDAFAVDFALARFQRRMRVGGRIALEFIARGRMWRLSFAVSPRGGTWCVALALLEEAAVPPTWVDARVLVSAPAESGPDTKFPAGDVKAHWQCPRPMLSVRMRAKRPMRARGNPIIVPMDGDGGMGGLQYAGCPYIAANETLHGRLEARLFRPGREW